MVEAAAHLHCRPEMPFKTETWDIKGKRILEVTIEKSSDSIYYAPDNSGKWKAYVRVHDQNLLANKIQLNVWKRKNSPKGTLVRYSREEKVILDFLSSHETISISKFKKIAKISKFKAEKILINLIVLDLIEIIFTENGALYKLKAEK
jgi:predicted HTH transcriptional regulator